MNTNRTAPRLFSFALAALITATMLASIDALARNEIAADSLMAHGAAVAARPV